MSGEAAKDRDEYVTVLICKNPLLRTGLKHLLTDTCFAVSDMEFDEPPPQRPRLYRQADLFIVDASNPSEELIEIIRLLKIRQAEARFAVIADHFNMSFIRRAIDVGVDGFCLAVSDREILIKSLELMMMGGSTLPLRLVRSMLDEMAPKAEPYQDSPMAEPLPLDQSMHKLSNREAQILSCLMRGEPNKVIARRLAITEATIKVHIKAILRKIGAANRTQAAMWAKEHLTTKGDEP